jgi:hypothetical protein
MANADPDRPAANDTPENRLLAVMLGVAGTQLIGLAAQLDIPDLLNDGSKSIDALAEATGTRRPALLQVMRALVALGIFAEPRPDHFAITTLGELLRTGTPNSLRGYAIMLASGMMLRGWANLQHALRTSQGALDDALGMETYAYLQQNKIEAAVFDAAMSSVSGQESVALRDAYDFSQFRTLVDVGGSRGLVLAGLLDAHPTLYGVLFDLPNVVEGARALLGEHVAGGRCRIEGGDFCADVPPGGDVYLLKRVLVVLDDDRSGQVLRNCRKAISPGGRLLVAEPDPSSLYGRLYDVFMLMAHGTRLRSEAEMGKLLAHSGFMLMRTIGTRSALRLFESVPA